MTGTSNFGCSNLIGLLLLLRVFSAVRNNCGMNGLSQ
jgi:hypothetical protein